MSRRLALLSPIPLVLIDSRAVERALPEVPGVEPGDTVVYDGVREVADRLEVDTALLHLGGVRFPVTGPIHYTMTGRRSSASSPMRRTTFAR